LLWTYIHSPDYRNLFSSFLHSRPNQARAVQYNVQMQIQNWLCVIDTKEGLYIPRLSKVIVFCDQRMVLATLSTGCIFLR